MNSVLPPDDRNAVRMKPKSGNQKVTIDGNGAAIGRDETRSFLNFSRENLSISHSELEQGFNKPLKCCRVSRQTLLSIVAIVVALVCAGIEIWKFHRVLTNGREIEILKRDVETLRHRLFGEDFMDELNAFEEQLFADGAETDENSGEADIDGSDYDNNYDEDYGSSWSDDAGDSQEPTTGTSSGNEKTQISAKNAELKSTSSSADRDRELVAMLAFVESKREQKLGKNVMESHKDIAGERLLEQNKDSPRDRGNKHLLSTEQENTKDDHPKRRRAITEETLIDYTEGGLPVFARDYRNRTKQRMIDDSAAMEKSKIRTTETAPWDRHPPKKYITRTRLEGPQNVPSARSEHRVLHSQRKGFRRFHQNEISRRSLQPRGMTKRHVRAPRQVFAAHYGADSSLFGMEDEHTGNGRAKHNEGIFKAWQPSDWVSDLGMTRHFTLSRDGRLTVHEPGLYLVYGQIHYLDEHDENGFHLLVNGQPILQCMVYSPGTGHKSRSCFSAQVTLLQSGDRLVLKDVGPARYTLFQRDKSFFGLVKLGDSRQQQPRHTTQSSEIER